MDSLHDMLRAIRPETKARDHLRVFREFLDHLDQLQRRAPRPDARRSSVRRGKA